VLITLWPVHPPSLVAAVVVAVAVVCERPAQSRHRQRRQRRVQHQQRSIHDSTNSHLPTQLSIAQRRPNPALDSSAAEARKQQSRHSSRRVISAEFHLGFHPGRRDGHGWQHRLDGTARLVLAPALLLRADSKVSWSSPHPAPARLDLRISSGEACVPFVITHSLPPRFTLISSVSSCPTPTPLQFTTS
jgi:hypothetical protein